MVNVFRSHISPYVSARALDNKRLARMCYESFDLISGAMHDTPKVPQELKDQIYDPPHHHRRHSATAWVGEDLHHFRWVLRHADALHKEWRLRYGHTKIHASYRQVAKAAVAAQKYMPRLKYDRYDIELPTIEFPGWFNHNAFRRVPVKHNDGVPRLPDITPVITRVRLSLLHKYYYADQRDSSWKGGIPPLWLYNPYYHEWVRREFGTPIHDPVDLQTGSDKYYEALEYVANHNRSHLSLRSIAFRLGIKTTQSFSTTRDDRTAVFDDTEKYRYYLSCQWSHEPPLIVIMLNPSTADAFANDPTVARVEATARANGYGGYVVLNTGAYRATKPVVLKLIRDPVGTDNVRIIKKVIQQVSARWGVNPDILLAFGENIVKYPALAGSLESVLADCIRFGNPLALELTKDGLARHPLYLKSGLELRDYEHPRL